MITAKNKVFIELLLDNCYLVRRMNFWWRGRGDKNLVLGENFSFSWWGHEQILGWWGDSPQ